MRKEMKEKLKKLRYASKNIGDQKVQLRYTNLIISEIVKKKRERLVAIVDYNLFIVFPKASCHSFFIQNKSLCHLT
jgi:hypothetical protein